MHDVSRTGRQALGDMRRLLGLLRDGEVKATHRRHRGATNADTFAPQPGLAELEGVAERVRSTGLTVSLTQSGTPFALSAAAELTVFRIVQEALTNAMKHADSARSVAISLTFDDPEVRLLVIDDGRPSARQPAQRRADDRTGTQRKRARGARNVRACRGVRWLTGRWSATRTAVGRSQSRYAAVERPRSCDDPGRPG